MTIPGRDTRARRVKYALSALIAALLLPAHAQAAELIVHEPDGLRDHVAVEQGETADFRLHVSAEGTIKCGTNRNRGLSAEVDTAYALAGNGSVSRTTPSRPLGFYSNNQLAFPLGRCGVTWDGAPSPYTVPASVTAARGTPKGTYRVRIPASLSNPGLAFLGPLEDRTTVEMTVQVVGPLEPPLENNSINVYPSTGTTYVKVPGGRFELLTVPRHIPDRSILDTRAGHAFLVSDNDGLSGAGIQEAELWGGYLLVGYSRKLFSGGSSLANAPITELALTGRDGKRLRCPRPKARGRKSRRKQARGSRAQSARRRRKRRRRGWARGRGRYRTKGRYGAGSVRGTTWYTEDRCDGTLVRSLDGGLTVRDFTLDRDFRIDTGEGYFAARAGRAGARN